jgi:hypothetical protein
MPISIRGTSVSGNRCRLFADRLPQAGRIAHVAGEGLLLRDGLAFAAGDDRALVDALCNAI